MNEKHDPVLQRVQAFDRKALADVYETYQPLIYSYIFRRVGDVEAARDLTADRKSVV